MTLEFFSKVIQSSLEAAGINFGKEVDVVGMGCSSTGTLGCSKNGVGGFGSELPAMAEV